MPSANLALPYLEADQAQKHVPVNEVLQALDALVHLTLADRNLTAPPGSPGEGVRYIVPTGATGAWSGQAGKVAARQAGAWMFYMPKAGHLAYVVDEAAFVVWSGSEWIAPALAGFTGVTVAQETLSSLSGAYVETTTAFPAGSVVFGVSMRVTEAVTGVPSFGVGVSGEPSKFGGSLGTGVGSTNAGPVGPYGNYSNAKVRLTPTSGSFTGGTVKLALHYCLMQVPAE
ncbi:DUF2793 domain-containing protein [Acuticoccus mangrovi]|uniref:DUF2793 domain-containing protein n=1 Tax=Acuticoccus mangrovi TaxID=2796142 RepID=A0A934IPQ4_9HYPH|nr:DUF2793 domain-containing protein [Acuticoccus mangrovi]MBJ3776406.1 DUF2793 domain-containing protein [Acuticoccus mangrovi]